MEFFQEVVVRIHVFGYQCVGAINTKNNKLDNEVKRNFICTHNSKPTIFIHYMHCEL